MVTVMLFQFTPLREGRRCPAARSTSAPIFQFTPLREGRRSALIGTSFGWMISIHAPPRGATVSSVPHDFFTVDFNSRPSARGDHKRAVSEMVRVLFQFTPLREGRHRELTMEEVRQDFNSRPSARGDPLCHGFAVGGEHFNSRPSARGDSASTASGAYADISIHAPPRGATQYFGIVR